MVATMKNMKPLFLFLLALYLLAGLTGCASTEGDTTKEGREPVSTVPWNRPQSWEGKGVLGGMVQ